LCNKNLILDYLPPDFPRDKYEKIHTKVLQYKDNFQLQYQQFSGGWRSLVYRYLACTKHSDDYIKIIKKDRISPSYFLRYEEERELFNFFTNGLSAIETLGYTLYMICSIDNSNDFKVTTKEDLKYIVLKDTVSKLKKFYSVENITKELEKLINYQEYIDWVEVRNVLMHRETPGRIIMASSRKAEKERSDLWFKDIAIDTQTTVCRLNWLELYLFKLIELTYDFTNKFI
jgi:hypothetical protein